MQTPTNGFKNLATFTPKGDLGKLFAQAKMFNRLNDKLAGLLPEPFKALSLCAINNNTATFVVEDQAIAFRAQKQQHRLLSILKTVETCAQIKHVKIKVRLPEYQNH